MADFPFRTVGFDLDGTLLDTGGDLAAAVNHALALADRAPLPVAQVVALVGGGARTLLSRALAASGGADDALVDRLLPEQLAFYAANIAVHTRPYPGVVAALDALAAEGVRLAVATNKLEALAVRVLSELDLARRFATILGGDTLGPGSGKPAPAMIAEMVARLGGPAAFVGDSIYDVTAAHAAGVPCVAVRFGFRDRPAEALGADALIGDFAALREALVGLG